VLQSIAIDFAGCAASTAGAAKAAARATVIKRFIIILQSRQTLARGSRHWQSTSTWHRGIDK
jgi:hypothetical protein